MGLKNKFLFMVNFKLKIVNRQQGIKKLLISGSPINVSNRHVIFKDS